MTTRHVRGRAGSSSGSRASGGTKATKTVRTERRSLRSPKEEGLRDCDDSPLGPSLEVARASKERGRNAASLLRFKLQTTSTAIFRRASGSMTALTPEESE